MKKSKSKHETIPLVCQCGHTLHMPAFNKAYYEQRIEELEEQIHAKDQQIAMFLSSESAQRQMPISLEDIPLKILISYYNVYPQIPTYDDLESATGYTRSTISAALKTLEDKMLLLKTGRSRSITESGFSLAEQYIEKMKNKN